MLIMNELQYILNQARLPISPSRHVKGCALQIPHSQWAGQAIIEQVDAGSSVMDEAGDKMVTTQADLSIPVLHLPPKRHVPQVNLTRMPYGRELAREMAE